MDKIFLAQVNRNYIIITKKWIESCVTIYQVTRDLGSNEISEILRKSLKILELMASPQLPTQKQNLDSCDRKFEKTCCETWVLDYYP